MSDRPRYQITFEALPDVCDPAIRLRQILKYAGRVQAMKCVRVEQLQPDNAQGGDGQEQENIPAPTTDQETDQ